MARASDLDKSRVLDLWARGDTSGEIAIALGTTRNAVLGIVHRARDAGDKRAAERKDRLRPTALKSGVVPERSKVSLATPSAPRATERNERILELWAEGQTAESIRATLKMGSTGHVVAIVSQARAAGDTRAKSRSRIGKAKGVSRIYDGGARLVRPALPVSPAPDGPLTLFQLQRTGCRWPLGGPLEPARFYCGRAITAGSSYCAEHHARACSGSGHVPRTYLSRREEAA